MTLDREDIEAIADALAARDIAGPDDRPFPRRGYVRADRVAAFLDVDRAWVYDHKADLGAVLCDGLVRFEAQVVRAYARDRRVERLAPEPAKHRAGPRELQEISRRPRSSTPGVELLPRPQSVR